LLSTLAQTDASAVPHNKPQIIVPLCAMPAPFRRAAGRLSSQVIEIIGGWGRDRTADLWVMNPPL